MLVLSLAIIKEEPQSGRGKSPTINMLAKTAIKRNGKLIYSRKFKILVEKYFGFLLFSPKVESPIMTINAKIAK